VSQTFSKEEIVASLRKFYADHGRGPKAADLGGAELPASSEIFRLFGGLRPACDAAGIPRAGRIWPGERMPWPDEYFGVKNYKRKKP
jgi:hypothetical protein